MQQLQQGCVAADDVPYADTILLRQELDVDLDPAFHRSLMLAIAASDPDLAYEFLLPALRNGDPVQRYVAGLYLALAQQQAGRGVLGAVAQDALAAMRRAAAEIPFPASDLAFFEALSGLEQGKLEHAGRLLENAIQLEPRFFNALALAMLVQMAHATRVERQGDSLCREAYQTLLESASKMMQLQPCAQQAAHLDLFLRRELPIPETSAPYNAVRVYVAMLSRRVDIAELALARFASIEGPRCTRDVTRDLVQLIDRARSMATEE